MSATVEIQTETAKNVVSVPIQAVTLREDTSKAEGGSEDGSSNKAGGIKGPGGKKECVFIVYGEEAKRIWVKTGIQDNDNIEIKEGISSDQEVITGPYSAISKKLKEGIDIQKKDQKDNK
jgi:HlyD family secretion protein